MRLLLSILLAGAALGSGCHPGTLCDDLKDRACLCSLGQCPEGAGGAGPAAGGAGGSEQACSMFATTAEFQSAFLTKRCGGTSSKDDEGCHNAVSAFAPKFDVPDAVVAAVLDRPPTFNKRCAEDMLVDSSDWKQSFLLRKIEPDAPKVGCVHNAGAAGGDRMPLKLPALSAAELACVTWWVQEIARQK